MNHLLHPELVQTLPVVGNAVASGLNQRALDSLVDDPAKDPNLTVAIRTYNEARKLERLLQDIARQHFGGTIEIVIVDNESTDDTRAIAKKYGAKIITLSRDDFTYPRSMNLAMDAASHDLVFLTVAHTLLATDLTLHAGVRHFKPDSRVAGVFSTSLPSPEAVSSTKWVDAVSWLELFRPAHAVTWARTGTLAATGAFVSKAAWARLGRFDERYEAGGEDTALARKMLERGYQLVFEPALAVHHSHQLGLIGNVLRLLTYVISRYPPKTLDQRTLANNRARLTSKNS